MKDDGLKPKIIKVDGGMVKNNWFTQFLSDVVNIKVDRAKIEDSTALGAAYMAGLYIGVYKSLNEISKKWKADRKFIPKMKKDLRANLIKGWNNTVRRTLIK